MDFSCSIYRGNRSVLGGIQIGVADTEHNIGDSYVRGEIERHLNVDQHRVTINYISTGNSAKPTCAPPPVKGQLACMAQSQSIPVLLGVDSVDCLIDG